MHSPPDLIEYTPVPTHVRASFRGYAWCDAIFTSTSTRPIATNYDLVEPGVTSSFMRKTLPSTDAIISWQSFHHIPPFQSPLPTAPTSPSPARDGELLVLYTVGPGADGAHSVAHGGFISALLDQAMGSWIKLHSQLGTTHNVFLNVSFKSALRTPGAVLLRAWVKGVEGRKIRMEARAEGEEGRVIAVAESLFIVGAKL